MKKRLSLSIVSIVILFTVLLSACQPATSTTVEQETLADTTEEEEIEEVVEQVTITYATFSANAGHEEDLASLVAEFEAIHPNIKVETQIVAFDDYFNKLQTMIAGDVAPDTYELNYENFVSYAEKGLLLDTTVLASNDASFDVDIFYPRAGS